MSEPLRTCAILEHTLPYSLRRAFWSLEGLGANHTFLVQDIKSGERFRVFWPHLPNTPRSDSQYIFGVGPPINTSGAA